MWQDGVASWNLAVPKGHSKDSEVCEAYVSHQAGPCVAKVMQVSRTSLADMATLSRLAVQEVKLLRALQAMTCTCQTYGHSESDRLVFGWGWECLVPWLDPSVCLCVCSLHADG